MSLNYYLDGSTHTIITYDSTNSTWEDYVVLQESSSKKYIQLDSDTSHENASHMRIRKNSTTYAVLHTGTEALSLWTFGSNTYGTLGLGDKLPRSSPTLVASDTVWKSISITQNESISGEENIACGIKLDGTLWSWGIGSIGATGHGDSISRSTPVQVGSNTDWKVSTAGYYIMGAIKNDGSLWTWGRNIYGELGQNDTVNRSTPTQVGSDTDWEFMLMGYSVGMAIKNNGTLWSWGYNWSGRLGYEGVVRVSSPVQVGSDTNWDIVEFGRGHTLSIKTNGTLWAWGNNDQGQLGLEDVTTRSSPVQVGSDTDWVKCAAGSYHSLAIKSDGTLWAFGLGYQGQLGNGLNNYASSRSSPVQIGSDTNWSEIKAGNRHSIAIKTDGTLWAWGNNGRGQLGQGNTIARSSPVQIGSDTDWYTIDGGYNSTVALKKGA
jgi:alpha-tubulin suppressor-like RCC1 family protein